jgi:glycine betaine/proline transport system ATP-binding protein
MLQATPKISCRHLWKIFGTDPVGFLKRHQHQPTLDAFAAEKYIGAVRDVSFDVMDNEILVIMGLSGSGKSTLIRAITRLHDPTAGEVMMDGKNLLNASPSELIEIRRHKMGMVFQNFGLLPHRNVIDNVAFPLEVSGMSRTQRDAKAREMLKLVGLEGREAYFPRELSGGQQQRVGIARSLAVGPEIWFLDEPFSALDPLIRREMQDEFIRLQKLLRKTILFITHDFDEAIRLADRIGIMKDGELVQLATPQEMVLHPANDYVREFVKIAPRDKILTLGAIARPLTGELPQQALAGDTKLCDAAAQILASDQRFSILNQGQQAMGTVSREDLIEALFPQTATL